MQGWDSQAYLFKADATHVLVAVKCDLAKDVLAFSHGKENSHAWRSLHLQRLRFEKKKKSLVRVIRREEVTEWG